MTTKQEIIDYIQDSVTLDSCDYDSRDNFNNLDECARLIKMIKDLKPEIKVKKLVWIPDNDNCAKYAFLKTEPEGYDIYKDYPYYDDSPCYETFSCEHRFINSSDDLEKCKEFAQKHWSEHVLSLLEVEPESLPNRWIDIKDPDKWLRENGFRTELEDKEND
jgi:hypothetical protein